MAAVAQLVIMHSLIWEYDWIQVMIAFKWFFREIQANGQKQIKKPFKVYLVIVRFLGGTINNFKTDLAAAAHIYFYYYCFQTSTYETDD